jgi:hypothetical protein
MPSGAAAQCIGMCMVPIDRTCLRLVTQCIYPDQYFVAAPCLPLQRAAELQSARSNVAASADAEQSRLLGLVSAQAAALADKERQLEV